MTEQCCFGSSKPHFLLYSKQDLHYTTFKNFAGLPLYRQCDILWQQVPFVWPGVSLGYSVNEEQFAIHDYCLPQVPLTEIRTISVPRESFLGSTHVCRAHFQKQYLFCVPAVPPEISHTTLRYCKWHWQGKSHPDTCSWIKGGEKIVAAALIKLPWW